MGLNLIHTYWYATTVSLVKQLSQALCLLMAWLMMMPGHHEIRSWLYNYTNDKEWYEMENQNKNTTEMSSFEDCIFVSIPKLWDDDDLIDDDWWWWWVRRRRRTWGWWGQRRYNDVDDSDDEQYLSRYLIQCWPKPPVLYDIIRSKLVNSLWLIDAICCYGPLSPLVQHQAITWTNVDLSSVGSYAIHQKAIVPEMLMEAITTAHLKITLLKSEPHLPGDSASVNVIYWLKMIYFCWRSWLTLYMIILHVHYQSLSW